MVEIIVPNVKLSKANQAAFSSGLICPFCNHDGHKVSRWAFVDKPEAYRVRYKCKDCLRNVIYDFSNHEEFYRMYKEECSREFSKLKQR